MSKRPAISFSKPATPSKGAALTFASEKTDIEDQLTGMASEDQIKRAVKQASFKAKKKQLLDIVAPSGSELDRVCVMGLGDADKLDVTDWQAIGGKARAAMAGDSLVTVIFTGSDVDPEAVAAFAQGWILRAYSFDKYKTKKDDEDGNKNADDQKLVIMSDDNTSARKAWGTAKAIAEGTLLARDLVNEPANELGPVEFAQKASDLADLGVEVEILGEKEMMALGMGALLGVAQGSVRPPRLATPAASIATLPPPTTSTCLPMGWS